MIDFYKRENWQFFTITNPFFISAFYKWFDLIPEKEKNIILEPFAWANNIVSLVNELHVSETPFIRKCFDIDLSHENIVPEVIIEQQDTIKNYPQWFSVAITNPPYLAKNSATRRWLSYEYPEYEDLYQKCLETMLNNTKFVAAIIPESFITTWLFRNRLYSFVSLTCKMFEDTDCPVCLALFVTEKIKQEQWLVKDDFFVYRMDKKLWTFLEINMKIEDLLWKQIKNNRIFNDKKWEIWIICIDNTKRPSIKFVMWDEISPDNIKVSSRSLTRVSWLPKNIKLENFLEECNIFLEEYRNISNDIWLTSFKWLREDNSYRRRLDFKTAKMIMNSAYFKLYKK